MKKFLISTIFFLFLLLFACTEIQNTPTDTNVPKATASAACETPEEWSLTYNRSGGFAGTTNTMTLDSDGNVTVSDNKTGNTIEGTLPPADVDNIEALLVTTCPFKGIKPADCADCFTYSVEVTMDGKDYQFETNDAGLSDSNVSSLIGALESVMKRALNGEF